MNIESLMSTYSDGDFGYESTRYLSQHVIPLSNICKRSSTMQVKKDCTFPTTHEDSRQATCLSIDEKTRPR